MPSEILVAIDGSEHSQRIVDYATTLAKKISASIALLYVGPATQVPEGYRDYAKEENVSESDYYDAIGRQVLDKYLAIPKTQGVACEFVTEIGSPATSVLLVAKERGSEMIIVGLQGLHGLARIRSLGSVSRRIIENSIIPVITVP